MDKKKTEERKSLKPLIKFFGIFIAIIAVYYIFVAVANDSLFNLYLNFTANIASVILNLFSQGTAVHGNMIASPTTVMMLSFGCEGTEPIIIFLAGMVAIPIALRKKWIQILSGIVILYILNFFRIIGLYFIQKNTPDNFETFHSIIFPIIFIFLALICLVLCIKWVVKK